MAIADARLELSTTDNNNLFHDQSPSKLSRSDSVMSIGTLNDQFTTKVSVMSGSPKDLLSEAMATYENIKENAYNGSATGKSIAEESMPCECKFDMDDPDAACGDDDQCINRMMFMECIECDRFCRNKRFQLQHYARVDVIRTEKKGFGVIALTDLPTNTFVVEYIGEVITNSEFVQRTKQYEASGLEHYYFMTLKTDEIIDATKKGCLARFINHSCDPNCVTQKWLVGKHMRIGIFTRRPVKAGTELTFDYQFERYGAVAQTCYCGESICKGYIGCSFEDTESEDDMTITPKQKKMAKAGGPLIDPDKVQSFVKCMLDSVGKSQLVNKLLHRLEQTNADTTQGKEVLKKFVRLHVLQVLSKLPLANKNGLEDAKMFDVVDKLTTHTDESIQDIAKQLLEQWHELKTVYRIPKRIQTDKEQETPPPPLPIDTIRGSIDPPRPRISSAPRFYNKYPSDSPSSPIPTKRIPPKLPVNWKFAYDGDGTMYYYNRITLKTQWARPQERVGSIEGVNQADLEDLVKKTIQDKKNDGESELKKQVGKIVVNHLCSKQKSLWNGDKMLFKDLARKMTHHIVDKEIKFGKAAVNTKKIETFIDSHGAEFAAKVQKKRKHSSISNDDKEFTSTHSLPTPPATVHSDLTLPTTNNSTHESRLYSRSKYSQLYSPPYYKRRSSFHHHSFRYF